MPQMMPLNWLNMYMYTSMLLIMMVILNYYMHLFPSKTQNFYKNSIKTPWKW